MQTVQYWVADLTLAMPLYQQQFLSAYSVVITVLDTSIFEILTPPPPPPPTHTQILLQPQVPSPPSHENADYLYASASIPYPSGANTAPRSNILNNITIANNNACGIHPSGDVHPSGNSEFNISNEGSIGSNLSVTSPQVVRQLQGTQTVCVSEYNRCL